MSPGDNTDSARLLIAFKSVLQSKSKYTQCTDNLYGSDMKVL